MKKEANIVLKIMLSLFVLGLAACSTQVKANQGSNLTPTAQPLPQQTAEIPSTYSDPFAYCAAVGTVDTPDARYTGPKIDEQIINGYKTAAGLTTSTEPMDMFMQTTIWRCMDKQVYACNFGANLPCDSKANTDKTPAQGMAEYCTANPGSDFIPMNVTGHDTIYSWHCANTTPEVLDQIEKVDAAGYLAGIWYPISSSAK